MNLIDSLSFAPSELGFGTSGLRGLETDMTDLECFINVSGFIAFLQENNSLKKDAAIYIAGDLRRSTPRILRVVAQAVKNAGYTYEYCGFIPTPALALYAQINKQPCIMVTGSHIPADRNGIKFYTQHGEVLKQHEANIKKHVGLIRQKIYSQSAHDSPFDTNGTIKKLPDLSGQIATAQNLYTERYINLLDTNLFKGKNIVIYEHSAVGRDLLANILRKLGANVSTTGRTDIFTPIDTENVTQKDQKRFRDIAQQHKGCFAIVSTDGDSDRPFVIDEKGLFHRGDVLGVVVARELGADAAAAPISVNDAVDSVLESAHILLAHTRIGSPYVIDAMEAAVTSGARRSVGWEVNGGFLIQSDITYNKKTLDRLPTRDAFLPILIALAAAIKKNISVSELFAELPERYTQAGLLDNFPQATSAKIITLLSREASTAKALIEEYFTQRDGFGKVDSINTIDGVRIYFKNGDIAHIRPSGNAPQLRIYSVADSQERADQIIKISLEYGGILRAIELALG